MCSGPCCRHEDGVCRFEEAAGPCRLDCIPEGGYSLGRITRWLGCILVRQSQSWIIYGGWSKAGRAITSALHDRALHTDLVPSLPGPRYVSAV